ncbi:putative FAD-linked oxidoreductase [Cladobotryum mycophilum]|uniref:FAD-linked oxidoreductase n=1 Tax=Cladobotryum mycophilum TaxID=491253 RepID=A0ABR0T2L5_9HYPO
MIVSISLAILLSATLAQGLAVEPRTANQTCRCRPHEACWPTQETWQALNASINGNLVSVRPVAAPCHKPSYNKETCEAARNMSDNSAWRSAQPGAVQWTNWEAWPEWNQSCYFEQPTSTFCGQGRVSLYSALVEKAEHIQVAVCFARDHNLRLAIKNSGHCFLGRSSAPESLQISTYKMKTIQFVDKFVPAGAPRGVSATSAVTIGAGVQLNELYTAVGKRNLTVVAGLSHTVGAAGGYIQGGGHSPLGEWKGMASDNALEFKVVTVNGDLVTANDYQNQDLFWALRGGGGGTFGVVVSVTIRTFPSVPAFLVTFGFNITINETNAFWNLTQDFHKHLPAMSEAGACGYYFVGLNDAATNTTASRSLIATFIFTNRTEQRPIQNVMDSFIADARKVLPKAAYILHNLPTVSLFINASLAGTDADSTGGIVVAASRMISRKLLTTHDGPAQVTRALREITEISTTVGFTGHVVAGGAVARNTIDTALNPAWRETVSHITFGADWEPDTTLAEQRAIQNSLTNVQLEKLRVLEPHMGAYLNEADANERDFQTSFWGKNYKRLYQIKKKLDPEGLFIVRRGVGSENWDDAGLCRVKANDG